MTHSLLILTAFLLLTSTAWSFPVRPFPRSSSTQLFLAGRGFAKKESAPTKEYPPLTQEEVEQWMGHIPVYAVTDSQGNGQTIQVGDNNKTVFYFFLSPIVAEAFLHQLPPGDRTVSGLFLGKIWYQFFGPETGDVEYRLVPDPRDWITAQTLLDPKKLKPYNEIPLFGVNHMPFHNKSQKVKDFLNQMVSSHYMFFSSRNMLDVLDRQEDNKEEEEELIFLHDIVSDQMQQPNSTTDFRNVVLVPGNPIADGPVSDAILAKQLQDPNSFVSQNFLQCLLRE